jgi:hypothetical protein
MAHYRIYLLNDYGKIFVGYDAECVNDAEVLGQAAAMLAEVGHIADQTEVWSGARCVGSISISAKQITPRLVNRVDRAARSP